MKEHLTVSEAAKQLGVKPRAISDLFYQRRLADDLGPIIGGRRLIPVDALLEIEAELERDKRPENTAPLDETEENEC